MSVERALASIPGLAADQRDRLRGNAERWRDGGTPQQQADGRRVLEALDAQAEAEHATLVARLGEMDASARVIEAFRVVPMTETEAKLLQVLLDNPRSTSIALSRALGWGGMSWHMHFGEMCLKRAVYLWPAARAEKRNSYFYSGILAEFDEEGSLFTMRDEVVAALDALGLRARRA
jgi:hypothetical protein